MSDKDQMPALTSALRADIIEKEWTAVSEVQTSRYAEDAANGAIKKLARYREIPEANAVHSVQMQMFRDDDHYTAVATGTPVKVKEEYLERLVAKHEEQEP